MDDLLKEAIADAKAVRETALENAKMALEEAFTPKLKSMLAQKIQAEIEDEGEDHDVEEEGYGDEDEEMEVSDEEAPAEEPAGEESEEEEVAEIADEDEDAEEVSEIEDEDEDAEVSEIEDEDEDAEEGMRESEDIEEEYEIDEAALTEEDDEDDKDEVDEELDKSSGIGKGDNKEDNTDVSSGIGGGKKGMTEIQAELKEYKEAVHFLKDKLHEVNILNAKLLFTNKLFKSYSLDNNQKLKVVETFDRAQTTREIKLVYSTLAEQFGDNGSINRKKVNSIKESASSAVSSTKPSEKSKKVISEESNVANRFKKLAGIINS